MAFKEYASYDAVGLAELVRRKEVSAGELLAEAIARTAKVDPDINAVVVKHYDHAERQIDEGLPQGPFTGVPFLLKDLDLLEGTRTTFGASIYRNEVADHSGTLATRFLKTGATIFGKSASPEFGLLPTTESRLHGPTRNPWNPAHSSGGSSGGAAAAVAARILPVAHASDGGGSIRIPASVCGLFGIKPTRGRISSAPLMPDLVGLGVDGPLTRTVADAALLLDVMTGNQPGDMYTQPPLPAGETFLGHARREPGRLRIGRTLQHAVEGGDVHPDCVAAYEDASALLASLGHEVEDIAPPFGPDVVPFFETLWYAMATLAPVDPAREHQLLPLTRYLRERGQALHAPDLIFAQAYLQVIVRGAWTVLNEYDAVLTPTLASPPARVGYFDEVEPPENFERQKRFTPYTAVYNVTGQPAVNLPLYWNADGLPIGVMLAGRMGGEATLLSLSAQVEAARPWQDRHPALW